MPIIISAEERTIQTIIEAIPALVFKAPLIFYGEIEPWIIDLIKPDFESTVTAVTALAAPAKRAKTILAENATKAATEAIKFAILIEEEDTTVVAEAATMAAKMAIVTAAMAQPLADYQKYPLWLAIAFNNPSYTNAQLFKIGEILEFNSADYAHVAGIYGNLSFVEYLEACINNEEKPPYQHMFDYFYKNLFNLAVEFGHITIIQHCKLIFSAKDWMTITAPYQPAVSFAAGNGHFALIKELITTANAYSKDYANMSWNNIFIAATSCGHVNIMEYLIQYNAPLLDPNSALKPKITEWIQAFQLAVLRKHVAAAVCIIEHLPLQHYTKLMQESSFASFIKENNKNPLFDKLRTLPMAWKIIEPFISAKINVPVTLSPLTGTAAPPAPVATPTPSGTSVSATALVERSFLGKPLVRLDKGGPVKVFDINRKTPGK